MPITEYPFTLNVTGVIASPWQTVSFVAVEVLVNNGSSGIRTVKFLIPLEQLTVWAEIHAVPEYPFAHSTNNASLPRIVVIEVVLTAPAGWTLQVTSKSEVKVDVTAPAAGIGHTGKSEAKIFGSPSRGFIVMVVHTQPSSSSKLSPSLSVPSSHDTALTHTSNCP